MDRHDLDNDSSLKVTVDEIITELNKQIATLNFDLTVARLAVQKLQNEFNQHTHPVSETSKINTQTF